MNEVRSVSISDFFGDRYTSTNYENISAVYSCTKLIANIIGDTPIITKNKRIESLLQNPNPNQTKFDFFTSISEDLSLYGNSIVIIEDNQLRCINWCDVQIMETLEKDIPIYYVITELNTTRKYFPEDILHFKNSLTSNNKLVGKSPIQVHKELFESSKSQSTYQSTFFNNSTQLSGFLSTLSKYTIEQKTNFQKAFKKAFGGSNNSGKVPLLDDGMLFTQVKPISPQDSDFINNSIHSKEEICGIFGVPAGLINVGEQKYSNAEQGNIAFQNYTIIPILTSISEELTKKLSPSSTIILRQNPLKYSSSKEKAETLSLLVNTGILVPNEAREFYNLKPIAGGDIISTKESQVQAPKDTKDTNGAKNQQLPKTESTI